MAHGPGAKEGTLRGDQESLWSYRLLLVLPSMLVQWVRGTNISKLRNVFDFDLLHRSRMGVLYVPFRRRYVRGERMELGTCNSLAGWGRRTCNTGAQVLRTLDKVFQMSRAAGQTFPHEHLAFNLFTYERLQMRCWLQSDNTVKEIRNSNAGKVCAMLLQGQVFTTMSHQHLVYWLPHISSFLIILGRGRRPHP